MTRLIGLHGLPFVGKDSLAKLLTSRGFAQVSFAEPIRQSLYSLNPWLDCGVRLQMVIDAIGWDAAKARHPELRGLMQRHGMYARDAWGADFWLEKARRVIETARLSGVSVVITDVRLLNEAEYIDDNGGEIYEVTRDNVPQPNGCRSNTRLPDKFIRAKIHNPIPYGSAAMPGDLERFHAVAAPLLGLPSGLAGGNL